jgi:hypothetical protein
MIFLISASLVARIIGMSYHCLAPLSLMGQKVKYKRDRHLQRRGLIRPYVCVRLPNVKKQNKEFKPDLR